MIGFVYSIAGIKHGRPTQWSHMLGVLPEFRNDGVGHQLKLLQRNQTLAMGLDLIEWTYDTRPIDANDTKYALEILEDDTPAIEGDYEGPFIRSTVEKYKPAPKPLPQPVS